MSGNVKPQCQHISQAYGDLSEYEYTPVVAASVIYLELKLFVNHEAYNEAALSSHNHDY